MIKRRLRAPFAFGPDSLSVVAGLVPGIHALLAALLNVVDARDKPGHDERLP
jgi:hypothetical protein